MGKSEEYERLLAELVKLNQVYYDCREIIRENSLERQRVVKEMCQYVTQRDVARATGMSESNVSRLLTGWVKGSRAK